jgi:hypothetical protein
MKKLFIPLLISTTLYSLNSQASWLDAGKDLINKAQEKIKQTSSSSANNASLPAGLSTNDISTAFKQALSKSSVAVVSQLGVKDGFNKDPKIRIPLPNKLKKVKSSLNQVGMGSLMDNLELKINRAAEVATPQAKELFLNAIKDMTFDDVQKVYKGPKDSATQYLQAKTSAKLKGKMRPIIEKSLQEVGAVSSYDKAMSKYKKLPFVPDVKADLTNHVINGSMQGMFHYIAQEEKAIRKDPVKQTTELLKKVFGSK